jgi:Pyruvate/2-oxoacid:ferredoxin oxidoreductase delta subunit
MLTKEDVLAFIKRILDAITPEQRMEIFSNYCKGCGVTEKPCYCMRDE